MIETADLNHSDTIPENSGALTGAEYRDDPNESDEDLLI